MYKKKDFYHQKAKQEGYLARSAYKLKEMNQRFRLLKANSKVLDLGCSPGAWTQVTLEILGTKGSIVGIDLEPISLKDPRLRFIQGDIFALPATELPEAPFECIISDMAPKTSGVKVRDQTLSYELALKAIRLCDEFLALGGNLVLKVFESESTKALAQEISARFAKAERIRPESTRQASSEIYLLGLRKSGRRP